MNSNINIKFLFLYTLACVFILIGCAKIINVFYGDWSVNDNDSIITFMPSSTLHLVVGILETSLAILIFSGLCKPYITATGCAILSSLFLSYRIAIEWADSSSYCGCLSGLDKLFGWSADKSSIVSMIILCYIILVSYTIMIVEIRRTCNSNFH